jgi:hypothetical protein
MQNAAKVKLIQDTKIKATKKARHRFFLDKWGFFPCYYSGKETAKMSCRIRSGIQSNSYWIPAFSGKTVYPELLPEQSHSSDSY